MRLIGFVNRLKQHLQGFWGGALDIGDKIIITGGHTDGKSGNTDLIKIETI